MMNTYRIRANQTVTWYLTRSGRRMKPVTSLLNAETMQANSPDEAITQFRALRESRVTKDQKRDISLHGVICTVESPERFKILKTEKFDDRGIY